MNDRGYCCDSAFDGGSVANSLLPAFNSGYSNTASATPTATSLAAAGAFSSTPNRAAQFTAAAGAADDASLLDELLGAVDAIA